MKNYWEYGTVPMGRYTPNLESFFSDSDLDSEDRFNKSKPDGWAKDSFTYKFNSHGFRSVEFETTRTAPLIAVFGCSFTNGVGLPISDVWPEQLKEKYFPNHLVYNFGMGGASADTVARLSANVIPIFKPDIVAILWPSRYRFETYENGPMCNGPWMNEPANLQFEDNTSYNNQTKNKLIVSLLKKIHGFDLIELDLDTMFDTYGVSWSKARDQHHYGRDFHEQLVVDFYLEYLYRNTK